MSTFERVVAAWRAWQQWKLGKTRPNRNRDETIEMHPVETTLDEAVHALWKENEEAPLPPPRDNSMPWEAVDAYSRRLSVPGGWLYQVRGPGRDEWFAPVFVPMPLTVPVDGLRAVADKWVESKMDSVRDAGRELHKVVDSLLSPTLTRYDGLLSENTAAWQRCEERRLAMESAIKSLERHGGSSAVNEALTALRSVKSS